MLLGRRKACSGVTISKTTATTTMPRTTGRTPLSPLRTRSHQARRYWPSDWARSSGGTSAGAASWAAVRSTSMLASAVPVRVLPGSAVTGISGSGPSAQPSPLADPAGSYGRPLGLPVVVYSTTLRLPRSDPGPAATHHDPVRDLEDVVEVVGDHHHRQAAVPEPFDQVQHDPSLHHPEGSGWLVKQHQLGVPHHRLGHRHRLPLTSRERGHWLSDRAHRGHPHGALGFGRLPLHRVLVEKPPA